MAAKLQILFFVIEKDQIGQYKYRAGDIDVCDVKYRKIDQTKIDEVSYIVQKEPVVQISCRS